MSKKRKTSRPVPRSVRRKPAARRERPEVKKRPKNLYSPKMCMIEKITKETGDTKTFRIRFASEHEPGQFVQVSILGKGEAPISIASNSNEYIELCVRDVGEVTHAMHMMKEKDLIGIRGPFGTGYPVERFFGKNIVVVGGGSGVAPLRGVIKYVEQNAGKFGDVDIMLGFRSPEEILFRKDLDRWDDMFSLRITVDRRLPGWKGEVGLITSLLEKVKPRRENAIAIICGPPIMIRFTVKSLRSMGFEDSQIWLSLERRMKCGMGKCGHCTVSGRYVCKDGPVFNYTQAKKLTD